MSPRTQSGRGACAPNVRCSGLWSSSPRMTTRREETASARSATASSGLTSGQLAAGACDASASASRNSSGKASRPEVVPDRRGVLGPRPRPRSDPPLAADTPESVADRLAVSHGCANKREGVQVVARLERSPPVGLERPDAVPFAACGHNATKPRVKARAKTGRVPRAESSPRASLRQRGGPGRAASARHRSPRPEAPVPSAGAPARRPPAGPTR